MALFRTNTAGFTTSANAGSVVLTGNFVLDEELFTESTSPIPSLLRNYKSPAGTSL